MKMENWKYFFVRLLLNICSDDDDDDGDDVVWFKSESFAVLSIIEIDEFVAVVDFGCQTLLFGCLECGRSYASA